MPIKHESKETPVTFDDGSQGKMTIQYPVKEKDRVYIVGCASCKDMVPWGDEGAEFWGVNNLYGVPLEGAHYDRWFEIHNIWQEPTTKRMIRRGTDEFRGQPVLEYMQGLAKIGCTIYMQKHWQNLIPLSVPYPLLEVVQFFETKGLTIDQCRYLTNTISYEIALAIYLGFKEIHVYGVDMAVGTEYENQRPSCEFWLGIAAGLGIKVTIPQQADLLKTRFLYGFEEKQQDEWRAKLEKVRVDVKRKRLQAEQQLKQLEHQVHQSLGAEQAIAEGIKIWGNFSDELVITKRGV